MCNFIFPCNALTLFILAPGKILSGTKCRSGHCECNVVMYNKVIVVWIYIVVTYTSSSVSHWRILAVPTVIFVSPNLDLRLYGLCRSGTLQHPSILPFLRLVSGVGTLLAGAW